jgi:phage repressor protein C with HTH and peptisase S24 domain
MSKEGPLASEDAKRHELSARLRAVIKKAGGNSKIAEISKIPLRSLNNYTSGTAEPKAAALLALADACGVTVDALLRESMPEVAHGFSLIPRLVVRPAAGAGTLAIGDEVDDLVAFRSDWLRRLGISPRFARAMFSRGDSMEPTIRDGDLLLVDESVDRVVDHGIYVVIYQGMVVVKRIQLRRDGALVLKSDNSLYDEEIVPAEEASDVQIAGRVRWFGRTI